MISSLATTGTTASSPSSASSLVVRDGGGGSSLQRATTEGRHRSGAGEGGITTGDDGGEPRKGAFEACFANGLDLSEFRSTSGVGTTCASSELLRIKSVEAEERIRNDREERLLEDVVRQRSMRMREAAEALGAGTGNHSAALLLAPPHNTHHENLDGTTFEEGMDDGAEGPPRPRPQDNRDLVGGRGGGALLAAALAGMHARHIEENPRPRSKKRPVVAATSLVRKASSPSSPSRQQRQLPAPQRNRTSKGNCGRSSSYTKKQRPPAKKSQRRNIKF